METENNQEIDADLEAEASAGDNSDNSESVQNNGDEKSGSQDENQDTQKKPKVWQVIRGLQKSLEDLQKAKPQAQVVQTQEKQDGLSPKDLYALMDAKVPQADVDEVVRASKLLGKSIPEALNDGLVKARLRDLAEQRQTASATNTSGSKRTTAKLTDEALVEKAVNGGDVDPEALAAARINLKKSQKK